MQRIRPQLQATTTSLRLGVCTVGVLIAPTEEKGVEAEDEETTEVAEIAPQDETAD